MGSLGKIIGGGIGFIFGGPIGAAIGAAAGHFGFDNGQEASAEERQEAAFYVTLFCCLAKMAKADGVISKSEVKTIGNFITNDLKWDNKMTKFAFDVMEQAKDDKVPAEDYLSQFAEIIQYDLEIGQLFIGVLYSIAMADGFLHPNELLILRTAESYLRLPQGTVNDLIGVSGKSISESYKILGCTPEMTNAEIKSAYRAQSKKFHSDHLQSKDLPEEFIQFANSQLILVREAYQTIVRERNM